MLPNNRDLWAGLMFIAVGLFFVYFSQKYAYGSAVRMGPGFFPTWLGWMLAGLGAMTLLGSFTSDTKVPRIVFRPLIMLSASAFIFGIILRPVGMLAALLVLVVGSALAGHEFKWKEVTILYIVVSVFSVVVFVKLLELPFPLWPAAFMD